MRGGLGRVAVALAVMLGWCAACAECVQATELPTYEITGTLSLSPPQVRGTVQVTFTNHSAAALGDLVLLLFPNRFAVPDTGVNDVNRPFVYPYQDFVPGWMNVSEVRVQGQLAAVKPLTALPAGWALRVALPAPVVPGVELTVSVGFETVIPTRFGTFGEYDDMLTAVGGWYPYLAELRPDGSWAVDAPPTLADFDVQLAVSPDLDVLLNGQYFPRPAAPLAATVSGVHYLSLVAAPEFLREVIDGDGGRIVFFHRPDLRTQRLSPGADFSEIRSETLRRIVDERPPAVPGPAGDIVVVGAPLRLDLTAAGEGMVLVSDRALKVLWLIRPFHEVQLAQAFYAEMLRPSLSRRESAGDYPWVSEGLSYQMAQRYREREYAENRSVQEWIELFNIFSIVDR